MKRLFLNPMNAMAIVLSLGLATTISSCTQEGCTDATASNYDEDADEDDGSCEFDDQTISGQLSADETWKADRIYFLDGRVVVPSGVTLTIEAGTIIKGLEGQETEASALIVARGGKIMANGTADAPVIFTTEFDGIAVGETESTLGNTVNERWGGLAILGAAPTSDGDNDTEGNLEGIPADLGYGKYGGTDAADNSGSLTYVSVRHGGVSIGEGNELNGITFAGVGNGTTVENIEVYATLDDGVEFFGGTVNAKNVLVYYQGDDGIDIDQNYAGTIDGFAVYSGAGIETDEALEIDGPEGDTYTDGKFTLKNGVCKSDDGSSGDFKSGAQGNVMNVTFEYGNDIKFRTRFNDDCSTRSDAYWNVVEGDLVFTEISSNGGVNVYDGDADPDSSCPTELDAAVADIPTKVAVNGAGASINVATVFSWTNAGQKGQL